MATKVGGEISVTNPGVSYGALQSQDLIRTSNGGFVVFADAGGSIVTSMTAAHSPSYLTTIGVAEAKDIVGSAGGEWNGQSVDASALLIKYTYTGDTDLSGSLDGDDYFLLDAGYGAAGKGFYAGDYDYSQAVDADDYFAIDSTYNKASVALLAPALATAALLPAAHPSAERDLLDELT